MSAVSKLVTENQSCENIDTDCNSSGDFSVITMPVVDLSREPYQLSRMQADDSSGHHMTENSIDVYARGCAPVLQRVFINYQYLSACQRQI